jgi:hypothetical protein
MPATISFSGRGTTLTLEVLGNSGCANWRYPIDGGSWVWETDTASAGATGGLVGHRVRAQHRDPPGGYALQRRLGQRFLP